MCVLCVAFICDMLSTTLNVERVRVLYVVQWDVRTALRCEKSNGYSTAQDCSGCFFLLLLLYLTCMYPSGCWLCVNFLSQRSFAAVYV